MTKYQTPVDVAKYMANLLTADIKSVLEPTSGDGNLVRALHKYSVYAPMDYFFVDPALKFDAVVMNPPFSSKSMVLDNMPWWMSHYEDSGMKAGYYMLFECMEMTDTVIALMPWYTISDSDVRLRHLVEYGLKSITVLPRKTFNYARIQTCIIELKRGWKEPTEFKVYEFVDKTK